MLTSTRRGLSLYTTALVPEVWHMELQQSVKVQSLHSHSTDTWKVNVCTWTSRKRQCMVFYLGLSAPGCCLKCRQKSSVAAPKYCKIALTWIMSLWILTSSEHTLQWHHIFSSRYCIPKVCAHVWDNVRALENFWCCLTSVQDGNTTPVPPTEELVFFYDM